MTNPGGVIVLTNIKLIKKKTLGPPAVSDFLLNTKPDLIKPVTEKIISYSLIYL